MLDELKKDAAERMAKCVTALRSEFKRMRTGRASTALLENLKVEYYGSEMPLTQVANVTVEDARTLAVTPWDKTMVPVIEGDPQVGPRPHAEHRRHRSSTCRCRGQQRRRSS